MWKHLAHPNIVPLLGVTIAPFQFISVWMPGGELSEYIGTHPYADRIELVGFHPTVLERVFTPVSYWTLRTVSATSTPRV